MEIELVFKPHPVEMNQDVDLIQELKKSSMRYIKTTANATGELLLWQSAFLLTLILLYHLNTWASS